MATEGGEENAETKSGKDAARTPQKVRELLSDSVAPTDQTNSISESPNASLEESIPPCDSANKEAFFLRVETFTSLKWAGMSFEFSPLYCAKYGWVNVDCDMLKCSSCQALLCLSLQPTQDSTKYKERVTELHKALKTAHEKFCYWPDSPCPGRFWALPFKEPSVLLSGLTERFRGLCQLEFQLPTLKHDDLKDMTLTEDTISFLLQLIEDEVKGSAANESSGLKNTTDILSTHVAACILALAGWAAGPSDSLQLPIIMCSYCMRKVGLWSFQQIETLGGGSEIDLPISLCNTPISPQENKAGRSTPTSLTISPHRMVTRSQDAAQSLPGEQQELSSSPITPRTRSRDTHSPTPVDRSESDSVSPGLRGKRPATRSKGQGEVPSSPQRKPKRLRLSSSTSSDSPKSYFDPVFQHRDWCPWITRDGEPDRSEDPEQGEVGTVPDTLERRELGWRTVLQVLLSLQPSRSPDEESDSFSLSEKSRKVFRIFRQWQVTCSS
eukprot:gi/632947426/ref/XP_007889040.1/ PREDICTED: nuclear-interacting partner of ALK [Callorhinchus milii]